MSFGKSSPSSALRWCIVVLPLILLFASSSVHAQQQVPYPFVSTNDCSNTSAYNSTIIGVGQHVWYVAPGGSDWTHYTGSTTIVNGNTIGAPLADPNYAAGVVSPGDLVCVFGGTYGAFGIGVSGAAYVTGTTTPGWIKFENMPGNTVTINGAGAWNGIQISANYIEVSGFTVEGDNASLNLTTALTDPATAAYNGNCIGVVPGNVANPTHVNIFNNYVHACPGVGIASVSADYVNISGNLVGDNSWFSQYGTSAISMLTDYDSNPSDTTTPYKMIVADNYITNNYEQVPWVSPLNPLHKITDGEGVIIDSNLNAVYTGSTMAAYTGRTLVANNVIYQSGSSAIEVLESQNVDVLNNSTFGDRLSFQNATSWNPTPSATNSGELLLYNSVNVRVLNNIFVAQGLDSPVADIQYGSCSLDGTVVCGSGNWLDYNLYYGGYANQTPTNAGYDADSVYFNPHYANTTGGYDALNLQIQSGYTSAIDVGTGWLAPATDLAGNTRVVSSSYRVPLGAYTYTY